MSKLYVNFNKLISSVTQLKSLEQKTTEPTKSELKKIVQDMKQALEKHDSCLESVSESVLTESIETSKAGILQLVSHEENVMDITSIYSRGLDEQKNSLGDTFTVKDIEVVGLDNALEWNLTKKKSLSDKISKNPITPNYDYKFYNNLLSELQSTTSTKKEKVVVNAIFLTTVFPHMPYYWGGGHLPSDDVEGVNKKWGTNTPIAFGGDDDQKYGEEWPLSLDCSGFVNWTIYNSGYDKSKINHECNSESYHIYGNKAERSDNYIFIKTQEALDTVEPGDIAHIGQQTDHLHVGIVVSRTGNNVIIAHCSWDGEGMNLTEMNLKTGLVLDDSKATDRIGKPYFGEFVSMDYDK